MINIENLIINNIFNSGIQPERDSGIQIRDCDFEQTEPDSDFSLQIELFALIVDFASKQTKTNRVFCIINQR